ncbi:PulJ/GspJ family protein [Microbacterium sp.]|uniref:PulJ/GspJ family protein n=1 Tax=Microbacterium sp. TaxID=51671 RepID=UPI003A8F839E
MNPRDELRLDGEAGLSLIELIIYMLIIGVIGSLITMLFVNIWQTEGSVNGQTTGTTRGQLISSQIERAMRNATAFTIEDGGSTLKVTTSLDGTLRCQGFTFDGTEARMTISASPNVDPGTWPDWQNGVKPVGSAPFFAANGANGVTYSFDTTTPDLTGTPVRFTGDVHMRNTSAGTLSPCW